MKRIFILTTFITTIAMGIGVLYFAPNNSFQNSITATNILTPEKENTNLSQMIKSVTDSVAIATHTIESVVNPVELADAVSVKKETTPVTVPVTQPTTVTNPMGSGMPGMTGGMGMMKFFYTNGTYSSDANYRVPDATNAISVSLVLKGDTVTSVSVSHEAHSGESRQYQSRFDKQIQNLVVGKPIDGLSLSRVGGASLTTRAFNQAVAQIKNQAAV